MPTINALSMKSQNFEFLRPKWPELAQLGGFAEAYMHTDAVGAIAKLRMFCEQVVQWIHVSQRLPKPAQANLSDLLDNLPFREIVPSVVLAKLHGIRKEGNKSLHANTGDQISALSLTREAHSVGRWLFVTYGGGSTNDCPAFVVPPVGGVEAVDQRKEKRAYLERIARQEAQLQQFLQDLEKDRSRATQAESTAEERRAALEAALRAKDQLAAVDPMAFDEAQTRAYLIDRMLTDEGWNVAPGIRSTEEVRKEVLVKHQPTASGEGAADYVLFDDNGKPLAVIEAKKSAEDPQKGRNQAKIYADGIEQEYHQRPVIFFTNGYDLWIWNDAAGEPWRRLYGFYSKSSLQHLVFQRSEKKPLSEVSANPNIAGRMYQIEAVRRVVEKFAARKRRALIVQATGTGKTRVAISLVDAMMRAGWAKRVSFKEFLPSEPRTYVTGASAGDTGHRVYLATYPAMMKVCESFDVGFFDLIIADESHRSLYNRYRQIFEYFDCYQVGLTATPVDFVARNTYRMFECDEGDPTATFTFKEAIDHNPPYLVPFEVDTHTTQFLREGIKYSQMTDEQKRQLEEDEEMPQLIEYEQPQVDKVVYNKDTNRHILRNLMEHGIRVADGTRIGKSIVFARSMKHARLLEELFNEMYPQYGGTFCQTIVSDDPRAESLIDDFKGVGSNHNLTIAISVDMLDTGVDVPEIVNLVFAKPVYSCVKFWQMIGRGTRLCEDLFGSGRDKTHFQIFDHWGNFERFEMADYKSADPKRPKSLTEIVFQARLSLAEIALEKQDNDAFQLAVGLLEKDIAALPMKTIAVRENWRQVESVKSADVLREFSAATRATLEQEVAPLMQWVEISRQEEAWRFDRLIARAQAELVRGASTFDDLRDQIVNIVSSLRINLSQVREKLSVIERVKSTEFWDDVTVHDLEQARQELRGIIQFRQQQDRAGADPKIVDVVEDESQIERRRHKVKLGALADIDLVAYRNRVTNLLQGIIDKSDTLQKIRRGEPVSPEDIEKLCSLVLVQEPGLDLHELAEYYPQAGGLDQAIREVIGMDAHAVHARFSDFVQAHPNLASHQIKFLDLLQNHIAKYGSIEIAQLYEQPFTTLHSDGPDGLFEEPLVDELMAIIGFFQNKKHHVT